MLNPNLTQLLVTERIDELHRAAAHHRRSSVIRAPHTSVRRRAPQRWTGLRMRRPARGAGAGAVWHRPV